MSPDDPHSHTTDVHLIEGTRPARTLAPPIRAAGKLVCLVGYQVGQVFVIGNQSTIIGRGNEAQVQLENSDISRQHARIEWRDGDFVISDLDSRNGTSVNGLPIQRQVLRIGDRIQVGSSAILVYARHDELEQRAQRLQKLESLAQLAGGMVHDFRNTLAIILANVDVLADTLGKRPDEDPDLLQSVEDIRVACGATAELTQRLLFFSRREPPSVPERIGLLALVEEVLALVRRSFEGTLQIRIVVAVDPRLEVRGQRGELHHALLNLCFNARDAMRGGGTLTILAEERSFDQAEALHLHLPAPGRYLELSVADTGVGIDEVAIQRVFEPFFTTKPAGEGTGLGLSTVFRVITNHGGNVHVESAVGRGSCFRLLLPDVITR